MQPEEKNTEQTPLAEQNSANAAAPGSVIAPGAPDTAPVSATPDPTPVANNQTAESIPADNTPVAPVEPSAAAPADQSPMPVDTAPAEQPTTPTEPATGETMSPAPAATPSPVDASAEPSMPAPVDNNLPPQPPASPAADMPMVPAPKKSKKKLFIIIGSIVALILLVLAYIFFIFIPSKPENVFKTGLNRSGFIVKLISDQANKPENTKKLEKTAFKGTISYTGNESSLSGTLDAKFNNTNANAKLTGKFNEKGQPEKTISIDTISTSDPKNPLPDIFVKVIGIKALQLDESIPGISDYEGKWLTIDKSVWEKAGLSNESSLSNQSSLSSEDSAQLSKVIIDVTREFVLTADPKKAVFENRKYIGKEKTEGITAHRYVVGFNKQNTQSYCEKLLNSVYDTKAFSKITDAKASEIANLKKDTTKNCQNFVMNSIKSDSQFEMWVNSSSKLIYKVRIKSKDSPKNYLDIGNTTKGRDQITLFANYYSDSPKSVLKFKLTTDVPSSKTSGSITYSDDNKNNFKATIEFAPYDGKIDSKAPAGAVPASEVIDKILGTQTTAISN